MNTKTQQRIIAALRKAAHDRHQEKIVRSARLKKSGMKEVGRLSYRDLFIAGLALYWGEGYKNSSQELGFTNSDPKMITFFIRWLEKCYGITKERLVCRISINKLHASRIKTVERYWRKVTALSAGQFTQPSLIRTASKKKYVNHERHFGTLRIKVRRGTDLRRQILGSIERLKGY